MTPIIVIGGGGHARVLLSVLKNLPEYGIVGYTDIESRGVLLGAPWLGNDDVLADLRGKHPSCAAGIGIGFVKIGRGRNAIVERLEALGFALPAIVSPRAIINEDVEIGAGTVVFDGVVVNIGARIGKAAIINTHATIEHDCVIGDFAHIAPGATLSGAVSVGANSLVGTGARVKQGVAITHDCLVGVGSAVIQDLTEPGLYFGTPAKLRKSYAAAYVDHR